MQEARQEAALARYEQAVLGALEDTETALVKYGQEQARRTPLTGARWAASSSPGVSTSSRPVRLSSERRSAHVSGCSASATPRRESQAAGGAVTHVGGS